MSAVAGTLSMDVPNARRNRTLFPRVTLTMTARRWSFAIASRTAAAMAGACALCLPPGVAALAA